MSTTSLRSESVPEFLYSVLPSHAVAVCDDVFYVPNYLTEAAAERCFVDLGAHTQWSDESIRLFGRTIQVPRRCAWFGDRGVTYGYSRVLHRASGWTETTAELRDDLSQRLGMRFNFVLLNLYRDGDDCMGWHSDDEPELGEFPCIASLSFGAPRRLGFRARDKSDRGADVCLGSGSLLVMWGRSQQIWQHSLPRARRCAGPRINLTFRLVQARS